MSDYYIFPMTGYKNLKIEIKKYSVDIVIDKERTSFEKNKFIKDIEDLSKYFHMIQKGKNK